MRNEGRDGLTDRGLVGFDAQQGERVDEASEMRLGAKDAAVQDESRIEDSVAEQQAAIAEVEGRAAIGIERAIKPQHDRASPMRRGCRAPKRPSDKPAPSPKVAQQLGDDDPFRLARTTTRW